MSFHPVSEVNIMRSTLLSSVVLAAALVAGPAVLTGTAAPALAQEVTKDPAQVKAGTYKVEPTHAKVTYAISHLGFSTYFGTFPKMDGTLVIDTAKPENSKVDITIDVAAVDSNDDKLDGHLRSPDFFDTAKFPTATFRSTRIERTGPTTAKVTGDLTLKGVTRPVTLDATFNQAGVNFINKAYTIGFDAETTINRTDWGISTYAPAVGEKVTLRIGAEFQLQP